MGYIAAFSAGVLVGGYLGLRAAGEDLGFILDGLRYDWESLRNIRRTPPRRLNKFGRLLQRLAGGYKP